MIKKLFLICIATLAMFFGFAGNGLDDVSLTQKHTRNSRFLPIEGSWGEVNKNEVFLELGGVSGLFSLNYNRYLINMDALNLGARVTFGNILYEKELGLDYTVGLGVNAKYTLANRHHLEFGVGEMIYRYNVYDFFEENGTKTEVEFFTYFAAGYTFNVTKGVFLKAQYTPLILFNEPEVEGAKFESWGGLSIGYSF